MSREKASSLGSSRLLCDEQTRVKIAQVVLAHTAGA